MFIFRLKQCDIFLIFAQNIACGYKLEREAVLTSTHEPDVLEQNKKKMYTPVNPSFTTQKWGVRGYSLHGLVIMMIDQFLVSALYSLGFFCHMWLTCFNLALNICFIIGRQMYM